MRPLAEFDLAARRQIRGVFTDIDDTLTTQGRLTAPAYQAMEQLQEAGLRVIPITGRPAGWCDHIARMWPVDGVVGENGAFYFYYDRQQRRLHRRFLQSEAERRVGRERLAKLRAQILAEIPGTGIASDQPYRETDLAIDFCEDVPRLPPNAVQKIVDMMVEAGATAKVSSIHVNGWFGDYDKLTMTKLLMQEIFDEDLNKSQEQYVFTGDSPNDEPMFAFFENSIGVANVRAFEESLIDKPSYVTAEAGGAGFAQVAACLLAARQHKVED